MDNIFLTTCLIVQHIHIGIVRLSGNIIILVKPIKALTVLQSIFLGVIIDDIRIIMVLPWILTLFLHLLFHGHYKGDDLGFRQKYGYR